MKKVIVILILMILIIPTVVNADTINSIDMNIYIDGSGDAVEVIVLILQRVLQKRPHLHILAVVEDIHQVEAGMGSR